MSIYEFSVFKKGSGMDVAIPPFPQKKISPLTAKILAIQDITGHNFPPSVMSSEVANYVTEYIYNTPQWKRYQVLFNEYKLLKTPLFQDNDFLYKIDVDLVENLSPDNKSIRSFIVDFLNGKPLNKEYILSIEKK